MSRTNYPLKPILVVDDEESILLSIDTILQLAGMNHILTCNDSRQIISLVDQKEPELILLDLNMPHLNGEAILDQVSARYPQIPIIIITGRIDADTAVGCMQSGAFDYIVKPVDENRLIASVKKSLQYRELHRENEGLKRQLSGKQNEHREAFKQIITTAPKMLMLFNYAASIATTSQPVLIRGETGTGKELMARAIHNLSGCPGKFIAINVAGLDDNVFSDTLFGHIKGGFTGAESDRAGLIEKAAGGTIFLDEIGDLSSGSQVKLLRLLQENEYLPIGRDEHRKSSARVIASTHMNLWELQNRDLFRQDLHYRLRTHRIVLPPLRQRKEDLPLLVAHFVQDSAATLEKNPPQLAKELLPLLDSYHFPGNIRELQAMVFDALAQNSNTILPLTTFRAHIARSKELGQNGSLESALPFTFADPLPTIKQATRMLVAEAMKRAANNQSTAASMLGISQQALSKRLKSTENIRGLSEDEHLFSNRTILEK